MTRPCRPSCVGHLRSRRRGRSPRSVSISSRTAASGDLVSRNWRTTLRQLFLLLGEGEVHGGTLDAGRPLRSRIVARVPRLRIAVYTCVHIDDGADVRELRSSAAGRCAGPRPASGSSSPSAAGRWPSSARSSPAGDEPDDRRPGRPRPARARPAATTARRPTLEVAVWAGTRLDRLLARGPRDADDARPRHHRACSARYLGGPAPAPSSLDAMAADPMWCASALALTEALMLVDRSPTTRADARRLRRAAARRLGAHPRRARRRPLPRPGRRARPHPAAAHRRRPPPRRRRPAPPARHATSPSTPARSRSPSPSASTSSRRHS